MCSTWIMVEANGMAHINTGKFFCKVRLKYFNNLTNQLRNILYLNDTHTHVPAIRNNCLTPLTRDMNS